MVPINYTQEKREKLKSKEAHGKVRRANPNVNKI